MALPYEIRNIYHNPIVNMGMVIGENNVARMKNST